LNFFLDIETVSIPYRYATNKVEWEGLKQLFKGFNPL